MAGLLWMLRTGVYLWAMQKENPQRDSGSRMAALNAGFHVVELHPFGLQLEPRHAAARFDQLTAAQIDDLKVHLAQQNYVVFARQDIDDAQFVAGLQLFGELTFTVGEQPLAHAPQPNFVTNVGRSRPPRSVWHTDTSYITAPPAYTALRAVEVPSHGGETLFASLTRALGALPEADQRALYGLSCRHVVTGLALAADMQTEAVHPMVRRHPLSGAPGLYLSTPERCREVLPEKCDPAGDLIESLYRSATRPENVARHRWSPEDLVIWDNRCSLHRADHSQVTGARTLHRGMIAGEVPIPYVDTSQGTV